MYGFSKQFTKALVALILQDPGFGYRVACTLDPELIGGKSAREVFRIVQFHAITNGSIPEKEILRESLQHKLYKGELSSKTLRKSRNYLDSAYRTKPVSRVDASRILKAAILDSEIKQALDDGWALYKSNKFDEFFKRMEMARAVASRLDMGSRGFNMRRDMKDYLQRIANGEARVVRYPIGISSLDSLIKGGLGRGEIGCVLGADKAGKSMALVHIAVTSILLGLNVFYISFELGEMEIENRVFAGITNTHIDLIEEGGEVFANEFGYKLGSILSMTKGNLIVKQFPAKGATVRDVEAYIKDSIRDWGMSPDVLIIDYADEMRSSSYASSENTYLQMGEIYSALRALGSPPDGSYSDHGGFDCSVWTASHVNRAAVGKELLESRDVRDSIRKAAIVDLMIAICQTEEEAQAEQIRLFIALCRYAPKFKEVGPYSTDFEHGRLVRFDSTVSRFRRGVQWQTKMIGTSKLPPVVSGPAVGCRMLSSTGSIFRSRMRSVGMLP